MEDNFSNTDIGVRRLCLALHGRIWVCGFKYIIGVYGHGLDKYWIDMVFTCWAWRERWRRAALQNACKVLDTMDYGRAGRGKTCVYVSVIIVDGNWGHEDIHQNFYDGYNMLSMPYCSWWKKTRSSLISSSATQELAFLTSITMHPTYTWILNH